MKTINILTLLLLFGKSILIFSQTTPVKIELNSKGSKLDAAFYAADNDAPAPTVILLHGFPGNQTSPLGLAEKLNHAGMNVLVFNYQGSYNSEGNFSFDNCIDNVGAAIDFVKAPENITGYKIDTSKIVICGYSFGGAIALESAIHNQKIRHIISIAGDDHSVAIKKTAADPEYLKGYKQFVSKSFDPGGSFRGNIDSVLHSNIVNVDRYDLVKNAPILKGKNIMLIVGWQDNMSLMEVNALPLYRKLLQLKAEHVAIKGFETDHSFKNVSDDLANTIIHWIKEL
jgi:uncharacterized protein